MSKTTYSSISRVLNLAAGVVCCLIAGCIASSAEEGHVVYLPFVFHAEAHELRTSACLQVRERTHEQPKWWENPAENGPASRAFREVVGAIQRKDRSALAKLSDPKQTKDAENFDAQADAFFQQFEKLQLVAVERDYELDGLAVFFAKFRSPRGFFFAPLVFARQDDGSFGFLPLRTRKVTYQILNDWFLSAWGPGGGGNPVYCSTSDVKGATHRISLIPSDSAQAADRSFLLLKGSRADASGGLAALAGRVNSRIEQMAAALTGGSIDQFVKYLTPEGGGRVKEWFASASTTEQQQYQAAIVGQHLFYIFDIGSVVVAYLRPAGAGAVQVMYFTFGSNNELAWTNSSHVTVADTIFKTGPLYQASQLKEPFSNIVIK